MENALQDGGLTLKKVLYRFGLIPDSWMKALKKEMARFAVWDKMAEHAGLTDEEKINAFRIERADKANTNPNLSAAAAWASLISSGRKSVKDIPQKKRASGLDCERVKMEGIWENDPPKLKRYFALYEEYRKERDRWNIPIPNKLFKKLEKLFDSGDPDKYLDELSNLIASWMKNQPPKTLSELLKPDKDRMKSLKRMAKPREEGGLEIPFPKKYPFGVYFLTVNVLSRIYGLRPEIMDAILTRTSEVFRGAKERQPKGKGPEILTGQVEKYQEVIEHISHITPKEIGNLESYLNTCFKRHYFKEEEQRQEIPFTDLGDDTDKIISQTIFFEENIHLPDEAILAKEKEQETRDFSKKFKKIFKPLPQRKREAITLKTTGKFTLEEIGAKLQVSSRTIKRYLNELRSDFQPLYDRYKRD